MRQGGRQSGGGQGTGMDLDVSVGLQDTSDQLCVLGGSYDYSEF